MATERANPAKIAPGAEQFGLPIDEPYQGFEPYAHQGQSLNEAFAEGAQSGRY